MRVELYKFFDQQSLSHYLDREYKILILIRIVIGLLSNLYFSQKKYLKFHSSIQDLLNIQLLFFFFNLLSIRIVYPHNLCYKFTLLNSNWLRAFKSFCFMSNLVIILLMFFSLEPFLICFFFILFFNIKFLRIGLYIFFSMYSLITYVKGIKS